MAAGFELVSLVLCFAYIPTDNIFDWLTIIENAQKSYVLLDATKLGQVSFVKVARIEDVSLITTKFEGALLEKIKEKTEVIEV